jgi:hypothetical protein
MKLITKATLVLICLSAMTILEVEASRLKRNRQTDQCKFVYFKGENSPPPKPISNSDVVYPGDHQKSPQAKNNAMTQTKAARKFFYKWEDGIKKSTLQNIARNFHAFLDNNYGSLKMFFKYNKDLMRQSGEGGTWAHWNDEYEKLGFGSNTTVVETKVRNFMDNVAKELQVYRTASSPRNLLGFIGLLGDIGTAVQDINNRENQIEIQKNMTKLMNAYFGDLTTTSKAWYAKYSPDKYYNNAERNKPKERAFCAINQNEKKFKDELRSGVLDVGETVDTQLGDELNIPMNKTKANYAGIGKVSWPWQTVPKKLITFCPDEPWAGHFSGSLYELLLMLEVFDREGNVKAASTPTLNKKKTYAAIASAFLVGTGMHSAVELTYVIKNYLEQPITNILDKDKVCTGASKYIADLIDEVSKMPQSSNTPVTNNKTNTPVTNNPGTKASVTASKTPVKTQSSNTPVTNNKTNTPVTNNPGTKAPVTASKTPVKN